MPTVNEVHVGGDISPIGSTGSISFNGSLSGAGQNRIDIDGQISPSATVNGAMDALSKLSGALTNPQALRGALRDRMSINGEMSIPIHTDKASIHYATTANWNAEPELVGEEGHIYIYSDYSHKEVEGETVDVPAIKVGDGVSLLIDAPFLISGNDQEFIDHINNHAIHVSEYDRRYWNNKVASDVEESNEELILYI